MNDLEVFRVVNVHFPWFNTYNFAFMACKKKQEV